MLIVVTGPAYSGRLSMAKALVSHIGNAVVVPITTTFDKAGAGPELLAYSVVSNSDYARTESEGRLAFSTSYGEYKFGVESRLLGDLKGKIGVLVCDARSAVMLGEAMRGSGTPSVCVYMHCSVRTMLFRRAAECKSCSDDDHEVVNDVYGEHSLRYSQLVDASESGTGYSRIIPVNSDRMSARSYLESVILPLTGRLEAELKIQE